MFCSELCELWLLVFGREGCVCIVGACVFVLLFLHGVHVQCVLCSFNVLSVEHLRCTHLPHELQRTDPPSARDEVILPCQMGQM